MDSKRKPIKKCGANQITADETIEDHAVAIANTALRPAVQAAFTLRECGRLYGKLELSGLVDALTEQTRASGEGNLKQAEAMITTQAHVLDALFNHLTRIAMNAEYLDTADHYLKLALRAQSQCRATWEAISTIQNPPMAGYVAQANIAHNQQINNEASTRVGAGARKKGNPQNKLLEQSKHEPDQWLDGGTSKAAEGADSALETLGEVDRTEVG